MPEDIPDSMGPTPGRLWRSVVRLRCPICLKGRVFEGLFRPRRNCPVCGYFFSRESGFFAGSVYLGYGATLAGTGVLWLLVGRTFETAWDLRVLGVLLVFAMLFPVWFFRYARMLWMALDLCLNPPVREDFQARGR